MHPSPTTAVERDPTRRVGREQILPLGHLSPTEPVTAQAGLNLLNLR